MILIKQHVSEIVVRSLSSVFACAECLWWGGINFEIAYLLHCNNDELWHAKEEEGQTGTWLLVMRHVMNQ